MVPFSFFISGNNPLWIYRRRMGERREQSEYPLKTHIVPIMVAWPGDTGTRERNAPDPAIWRCAGAINQRQAPPCLPPGNSLPPKKMYIYWTENKQNDTQVT